MERMVAVGVITGAHGVKGEVKLRSFTADPLAIAGYNPLETETRGPIEIVKLRAGTDGMIAALKGVSDRDHAEALKATQLFVPRSRLPEPNVGEVYLGDLVVLVVLNGETRLGEVIAVPNFGAGYLLEVKIEARRDTIFIPFTEGFVKGVDIAGRTIVIELPGDFLDEEER
jgi:16S rRNA processing protein RimM